MGSKNIASLMMLPGSNWLVSAAVANSGDVSDDRSTLFVHALDVGDPDEFRRSIVDGFERRVLELLR